METGIVQPLQHLLVNGEVLGNLCTAGSYVIKGIDTLDVFTPDEKDSASEPGEAKSEVRVFVKLPSGKTIPLTLVLRGYTVAFAKLPVQAKTGLPQQHQRLVFRAHVPEDDFTRENYSIRDHDVVQLFLQISGEGKRARVAENAFGG